MRAVLRFVASVMMVSGVLLISDAGVTLLWQEPVSAYVAEQKQGQLKDAFFDPPQRVIRRQPLKGDSIAHIDIPSIGVSEYVVEGTDVDSLRKGPGHYPETPLPGEPGTSAIAGHRTTYGAPFRRLSTSVPSTTYFDRPMLGIMISAMASPFSGRLWITRSGGSKNAFLSVPWFFPAT